jgi:NADH:ubiquinone oxidoreductase subunit 5 (subunit L)/multisubunit Na+/H+ antiporter MnhA subunit
VIVQPLLWISTHVLWKAVDVGTIDGAVNGIAEGLTVVGDGSRRTQSGNTRSYAVWVVIGAILVVAVIFWPHVKPVLGVAR